MQRTRLVAYQVHRAEVSFLFLLDAYTVLYTSTSSLNTTLTLFPTYLGWYTTVWSRTLVRILPPSHPASRTSPPRWRLFLPSWDTSTSPSLPSAPPPARPTALLSFLGLCRGHLCSRGGHPPNSIKPSTPGSDNGPRTTTTGAANLARPFKERTSRGVKGRRYCRAIWRTRTAA